MTVYEPADWQKEDLDFLENRDFPYSANWSEMGARKTTTGLWLIERKVKQIAHPRVLIVTTKSGKGTYFDAIPKSYNGNKPWAVLNVGARTAEDVLGNEKMQLEELVNVLLTGEYGVIVLAHYHCFLNKSPMREILAELGWDFVLLDEAHRIKNRETQWTRNIKRLKSGYRHVMTGTGFINDPSEFWSLVNFLDRDQFSSYWRFRRHFCVEEAWSGFNRVTGVREETEQEFIDLRRALGPRRKLRDVHPEIAEPVFTAIDVELNPTQRRMYKEILKELWTLDQEGYQISSPNVLSQLSRLRQISVATPKLTETYFDEKLQRRVQVIELIEPSSKLDATMELIEGLEWDAEDHQQVVVFSNFRDPLELLKVRLDKAGISYMHMQQSDSDEARYEKWAVEWPKKEHQVFLTTLALGSESINLSSAQHAIFLDRSWSPKDNMQAVSRLYRPGQTGVPQIIHINAINTIDKKIMDRNTLKQNWFKKLFED